MTSAPSPDESNLFFILESSKGFYRLAAGFSVAVAEMNDELVQITHLQGKYYDPVEAFEALRAVTPEWGIIFQTPVHPENLGEIWLSELTGSRRKIH